MYQGGDIKRYVNVWGKQFPNGLAGVPVASGLDASILIQKLIPLLRDRLGTADTTIDTAHFAREEALQEQVLRPTD